MDGERQPLATVLADLEGKFGFSPRVAEARGSVLATHLLMVGGTEMTDEQRNELRVALDAVTTPADVAEGDF